MAVVGVIIISFVGQGEGSLFILPPIEPIRPCTVRNHWNFAKVCGRDCVLCSRECVERGVFSLSDNGQTFGSDKHNARFAEIDDLRHGDAIKPPLSPNKCIFITKTSIL